MMYIRTCRSRSGLMCVCTAGPAASEMLRLPLPLPHFHCSLNSTFIAKRSVTIEECNMDEDFDLTQCNTSVLTTNCSTDDLAWVQCALGSE